MHIADKQMIDRTGKTNQKNSGRWLAETNIHFLKRVVVFMQLVP
jgi:hypothetical protein